jgi:release factor glutamine methyltransferase
MLTSAKLFFDNTLVALDIQPLSERKSVAFYLLEDAFNIDKTAIALDKEVKIDLEIWQQMIERLNQSEPVQQVVGFAWFRNRKFKVNPNVLIPRPETEELIDHIKSLNLVRPRIADLGTGSGCIAISLALEIPDSEISALDISEDALSTAKENAGQLKARVNFFKQDILNSISFFENRQFDLLVSNPPYICEHEKAKMEPNVLNYEPHLALFVPDHDPLIFYRSIAVAGQNTLADGGFIFVEINSGLGQETKLLFENFGYTDVTLMQDFYGKNRFVSAKKTAV